MGKSKYQNLKPIYNGITFDSYRELNRYRELLLLEKSGAISDLQRQAEFVLIPAQYKEIQDGVYLRGEKKGQPKIKKICLEKAVKYIADFVYFENGQKVVEDSKGMKTKDYIIKRKLMLYIHNIKIKET